ncbi:hypothetical protein EDD18DRAFT_1114188 [Armillaria luteobubalina]|uniref:Uncharacterized protein n=1 Tax=Armillaria luteobubalina TaxID=153913 RepID=A0AA39P6N1_9AGAR|nr:hypothetical protein EDD18DRAFT_1114188 [Armillaria luteobubalina]
MVSLAGCPRKYHTVEEQQQAHAVSSARSHERYKASINHERRHKHRSQCSDSSCSNATPSVQRVVPRRNVPCETKPSKTLATMMLDRIAHTNKEFMALIKRQPHAYADRLFLAFIATITTDTPEGDDSQICKEITKIGEFIDTVNKHESTILNAAGVGQELAEAHEYRDCMEEVQKWLEDILCSIMEGVDVLIQTHRLCGLLYQHAVHSAA